MRNPELVTMYSRSSHGPFQGRKDEDSICRESRVLRLASFLSFSSAVPPLAVIDLYAFILPRFLLHSLRLSQNFSPSRHPYEKLPSRREGSLLCLCMGGL